MTIKIDHIVVLARKPKTTQYYFYQCTDVKDIQHHSLPIKIFINGFDFTRKLTTRTRLSKPSLRYIIENLRSMSFKNIKLYFQDLYSDARLKRLKTKRAKKRSITGLTRIEFSATATRARPINFVPATSSGTAAPRAQRDVNRVKSQRPVQPSASKSLKAVGMSYNTIECDMQMSGLRKHFDRAFLVYLQSLVPDVRKQTGSFGRSFSLYFDHAVFPFLVDHGFKDVSEFQTVMEKLLAISPQAKIEDYETIFSVMHHQHKLTFTTPTNAGPELFGISDLADAFEQCVSLRLAKAIPLPSQPVEPEATPSSSGKAATSRKRKGASSVTRKRARK